MFPKKAPEVLELGQNCVEMDQSHSQDSDSSSSPQSPRGYHILPFLVRSRLLTEETVLVRNANSTMAQDNPFKSMDSEDQASIEEGSEVSSLSDDSRRRLTFNWNGSDQEPRMSLPPQEITITKVDDYQDVPQWLRDNDSDAVLSPSPTPSLSPIQTPVSSPVIPRPTLRKYRSVPVQPTIREEPSRRSLQWDSSSAIPETKTLDDTLTTNDSNDSILGNRPRRQLPRGSSTTYSVGSIVGQSSFVTSPTATSSSLSETTASFQQQQRARQRTDVSASSRRGNPVKEEIKYMWGRVATPIRRLTKTEQKVDLNRSKTGTLT